jgi:hypothetical protein
MSCQLAPGRLSLHFARGIMSEHGSTVDFKLNMYNIDR